MNAVASGICVRRVAVLVVLELDAEDPLERAVGARVLGGG